MDARVLNGRARRCRAQYGGLSLSLAACGGGDPLPLEAGSAARSAVVLAAVPLSTRAAPAGAKGGGEGGPASALARPAANVLDAPQGLLLLPSLRDCALAEPVLAASASAPQPRPM